MKILILRFDAPLMSFGGVMVDHHGPTDRFPGKSLLTGLFGNALGYEHKDYIALQQLQSRLEYAARWDVPPSHILDYHTVDLGQDKMRNGGWTTWGEPEHRAGSDDTKYGTHIRLRHYWANGVMTIAISLKEDTKPTIDDLAHALQHPERPLFIGRKTCLPATPVFVHVSDYQDVLRALKEVPICSHPSTNSETTFEACWPYSFGGTEQSKIVSIYDQRDWKSQFHTGRRYRIEGFLEVSQ